MNLRTIAILALLLSVSLLAASAALVMVGKWHDLFGAPLAAEIKLHAVSVPETFEVDPVLIADEIVKRMKRRSETDTALRIMLNSGQNQLLRESAIPRLVNAGVIRRMLDEMEGLGTVIEFATFRSYAPIRIENSGQEPLTDVALILPHAKRAERRGDGAVGFRLVKPGIGAVSLASLAPGEAAELKVWFDAPPAAILDRKGQALLGAAGDVRGDVRLYSATSDWNGADLEITAWARWLVALFCVAIAFAALAGGVLAVASRIRGRPASGALHPPDAT